MAYIAPDSIVQIMRDVPFNQNQEHVVLFSSSSAQETYFNGTSHYTFEAETYTRVERGKIRLPIKADSLYSYNYGRFQNRAFGSKWFYFFILGIEYINNQCTEITFQIDPWQTYNQDINILQCYVEREHVASDIIGEHTVPENFETGPYNIVQITGDLTGDLNLCIVATENNERQKAGSRYINKIYTNLYVATLPSSARPVDIDAVIGEIPTNAFVAIYQYPSWLGFADQTTPATKHVSVEAPLSNISGYVPRNKKLFTYPYNVLVVSNNVGGHQEYRYENFIDYTNISFTMQGVFFTTPCIMCAPDNYGNVRGSNLEHTLELSTFPTCAYAGDSYKDWLATNKNSYAVGMVSNAVSTAFSVGSKLAIGGANPAIAAGGAAISGMLSAAQGIAKVEDIKATPPSVAGKLQTDSLNAGLGRIGFTFYAKQIKQEYAKQIDDFFSAYGYQVNRLKKPNINTRPFWNYVKTSNAVIRGNAPTDDLAAMENDLNKGITFWKNVDNIGNYSLNNSISA